MPELRDPKFNPRAADTFRKWGVLVRVYAVSQGCVYTTPPLSDRGWIGILEFQRWAAAAEVVEGVEAQ